MWNIVSFCLVIVISSCFGQNINDSTPLENTSILSNSQETDLNDVTEELGVGTFFDKLMSWASTARDYNINLETSDLKPAEDGRKLKHRKGELKFIMKTLVLLKVVLGLILPLGIISSKILSWKAVTLSLMAFMLAKILFVKNLLAGKNAFSVTPANFVPPLFIHGGPNDVFWKRQGEMQNQLYSFNSS